MINSINANLDRIRALTDFIELDRISFKERQKKLESIKVLLNSTLGLIEEELEENEELDVEVKELLRAN